VLVNSFYSLFQDMQGTDRKMTDNEAS